MVLLLILTILFVPNAAHAQQAAAPCVQTTDSFGVKSCVPVSTSNPLPVSIQ